MSFRDVRDLTPFMSLGEEYERNGYRHRRFVCYAKHDWKVWTDAGRPDDAKPAAVWYKLRVSNGTRAGGVKVMGEMLRCANIDLWESLSDYVIGTLEAQEEP